MTPYVVPAVSAPTFEIVILSTVPAPAPCTQAAVKVPEVGKPLSICQLVPVRSAEEEATEVTVSAPAVLHQFVSSPSGNSIVIVPPVVTALAVSIAIIISTVWPAVPAKFTLILLINTYTAANVPACVVAKRRKERKKTRVNVGMIYFNVDTSFFTNGSLKNY